LDTDGFRVEEIVPEPLAVQEAWVMAAIDEPEGDELAILPANTYELVLLHRSQWVNSVENLQRLQCLPREKS
jgi:hypothetical protein